MASPGVLSIRIIADATRATQGMSQVETRASRLQRHLKVAFAVAGVAVVKFAKDSIGAASDLQQNLGGADAVFGKYSKTVISNAKAAADGFGLSQNQYLESANKIGALLHGQGVASDKLAGSTQTLIAKGADLAATFGGSTADAVDALSSALKGETDPIERYGISIKQSDISARLAATGMNKLTGKAQKLATQQAALYLINKQSTNANGQFAKQTGSLAEQQQILAAKFNNVKAQVGSALLPIISKLFSFFLTKVIPVIKQVQGYFQAHADTIKKIAIVLVPLIGALGAFILVLKAAAIAQALLNVVMTANPIGLVIAALAALAVGLVYAWKKSETFREVIKAVFTPIRIQFNLFVSAVRVLLSVAKTVWNALSTAARATFGAVRTAISSVVTAISSAYTGVKNFGGKLLSFISSIPGKISGLGGKMKDAGSTLLSKLFDGFKKAAGFIGNLAEAIGKAIVNKIVDGLNALLPHHLKIHIPIPAAPDVNISIPLIPNIPHINAYGDGNWLGAQKVPTQIHDNTTTVVYIGNEQVDAYVEKRVSYALTKASNRARAGVR